MHDKYARKSDCGDVIILHRNPLADLTIAYPKNAKTLNDVLCCSCQQYCSGKHCRKSVESLYRLFLDLQLQFRQLNKNSILSFYDEKAVVLFQGNFLKGKVAIGSRFIDPLLSGSISVNPDYTTLCYSVLDDEVVQYGSLTITSYQALDQSSSKQYNVSTVLTEHYNECSKKSSWKIVYQSLELKQ